jgi:hypothetical protein
MHLLFILGNLFKLFMNDSYYVCLFDSLVCDDISGGQERIPIPATNLVDDPPIPPSGMFVHISGQFCILLVVK